MNNDWETQFKAVYGRGSTAWMAGRKSAATMFTPEDASFLATIGCTTQELFDFVDDWHRYGEPDFDAARAVAAIRRDYFLNVLQGRPTTARVSMDELPPKTAAVDGIVWLPRLIAKARAKLRGEMPDDLMYGCGGDRECFGNIKMTMPAFLELVRDCGEDTRRIVETVKKSAGRS
jgi:hypothetical protein